MTGVPGAVNEVCGDVLVADVISVAGKLRYGLCVGKANGNQRYTDLVEAPDTMNRAIERLRY